MGLRVELTIEPSVVTHRRRVFSVAETEENGTMTEMDWRRDPRSAAAIERLVGRIDQVSGLVENGSFSEARSHLSGRGWAASIDVATVPADVLRRAQAWMDAADDSLRQADVEADCVRRSLGMARRELAG